MSEIGRKNIENIKRLGVDYVEMSPNPLVRAKLNRIGLTQVGDISWPEHVGIFTIPVRAAVQFNVPLIVWGENSQNEYGGPAAAAENNVLNRRWLEEFGGLLGMRVSDLIGMDGIEAKHLIPYTYPSDEELAARRRDRTVPRLLPAVGRSVERADRAGERIPHLRQVVEGSMVNYENLDNHQTGIHDYFKFLKFGFGRATDLACLHIRRGRLDPSGWAGSSQDAGRQASLGTTWASRLQDILRPLDMTVDEFVARVRPVHQQENLQARRQRRPASRTVTATSPRSTTTTYESWCHRLRGG